MPSFSRDTASLIASAVKIGEIEGTEAGGVGRIVRPRKAKSEIAKIGYPPPVFGRGVGHLWPREVEGGRYA